MVKKKAVRDELCKVPSLPRAMLGLVATTTGINPKFEIVPEEQTILPDLRKASLSPACCARDRAQISKHRRSIPQPQSRRCYCLGLCTAQSSSSLWCDPSAENPPLVPTSSRSSPGSSAVPGTVWSLRLNSKFVVMCRVLVTDLLTAPRALNLKAGGKKERTRWLIWSTA